MRVAIVGQQAFGAAVLDAFALRGHEVVAAFAPLTEPGAPTDPLREAAIRRGARTHTFSRRTVHEARARLREAAADLAVLAYVTAFVPQTFCRIPKLGAIQFHPSLLPEHRGPSAINWAIIRGCARTGISVFRPVDGLDEGPIILQQAVEVDPDDTAGSLYFKKLFPLGVSALIEAAERMASGSAIETVQSGSEGSYEGWVHDLESQIHWGMHVDRIYDLIRGCDPAPGAWTQLSGKRLQLFDVTRITTRTFSAAQRMRPGTITAVSPDGFTVRAPGGFIEVRRCQLANGNKISAGNLDVRVGMRLGRIAEQVDGF